MGNGLRTRLEVATKDDKALSARDPDTAELIARERLANEQRKNRLADIAEAERLGRLVPVEDMRRELGKALQRQLSVFTGMVPDLANAIAATPGPLPARDLVHLIRRVMNEKLTVAASEVRAEAELLPDTVEGTFET